MTTPTHPECETCNKVMSIAQAVVMVVAGVTYVSFQRFRSTKLKPRWNLPFCGAENYSGWSGEDLSPVLVGRSGAVTIPTQYAHLTLALV